MEPGATPTAAVELAVPAANPRHAGRDHGGVGGAAAAGENIVGILFVQIPCDSLCILDVFMNDSCASSDGRHTAREAGVAAGFPDSLKQAADHVDDPDESDCGSLSHESLGRLVQPAVAHVGALANIYVRSGDAHAIHLSVMPC